MVDILLRTALYFIASSFVSLSIGIIWVRVVLKRTVTSG